MITGTWMEIVNCQVHGPDIHHIHNIESKTPPDGYTWSGGDLQENTRPQGPTDYGQRLRNIYLILSSGETHRNIGKRMTKYACCADADESTRPGLEGAGHKPH